MTRMLRLGCASFLAPLVALVLIITPAHADPDPLPGPDGLTIERPRREPDPIDMRFDIGALALYSVADLDGRLLDDSPAYRPPDLRLKGRGAFTGGGLSGAFVHAHSFRFATTITAFAVPSVALVHAPLSPDLSLSLQKPHGFTLDCAPGWEFNFGHFVPYVDAVFGVAVVNTSVDVRSIRQGPEPTLHRSFTTPIVAPRLGLQYRLGKWVALDVSASISPVGVELLRLSAGLTFTMIQGP